MVNKKRKAVSPVIATVVLVAVTITVAVAVSYWMSGIASQYTGFEKVEIQTAICTLDANGNWQIAVKLKNSGTKTTTLTNVFVNDVEVVTYDASVPAGAVDTITTSLAIITPNPLESGNTDTVNVWIGATYGFLSSGTTVNIKLHSAGGMDYIRLVMLI